MGQKQIILLQCKTSGRRRWKTSLVSGRERKFWQIASFRRALISPHLDVASHVPSPWSSSRILLLCLQKDLAVIQVSMPFEGSPLWKNNEHHKNHLLKLKLSIQISCRFCSWLFCCLLLLLGCGFSFVKFCLYSLRKNMVN